MSYRTDFLTWVKTALYEAEHALHNGDPAPRRALWSRNEPVSVLGAWRNAHGQREVDELFTDLGKSFSDCTSYVFELLAYDVVGDMAYTAGLEHTSACVDGQPRRPFGPLSGGGLRTASRISGIVAVYRFAPRRVTTARMNSRSWRATQVYRREEGEWRVAHRHGDTVNE